MYFTYEIEEWVGVSPDKAFSDNLDKVVLDQLRTSKEGIIDPELGLILAVLEAKVVGDGIILPLGGDPDIYFPVRYKILSFRPLQHEIVRAIVSRVESYGAQLRLGPIEGKVHKNDVMDENAELTPDGQGFRGVRTKREIRVNDIVRARINTVASGQPMLVALSMRHPYLGKEEWIRKQRK